MSSSTTKVSDTLEPSDQPTSPSIAAWSKFFSRHQTTNSRKEPHSKPINNSNTNPSRRERNHQDAGSRFASQPQQNPNVNHPPPNQQQQPRKSKSVGSKFGHGGGRRVGGNGGGGVGLLASENHQPHRPQHHPPQTARNLNPTSNNSIRNRTEHEESMKRLRRMILTEGIPSDEHLTPSKSTYRSVVWKLLLDIRQLPISPYLELVSKGKSPVHDKVRNDTFRTLATDQGFKEKVKEEKLIRLLEAFVWKFHESPTDPDPSSNNRHPVYDFSYVQGMNVLAAPFLYTLPTELEAFHCFSRFIETCCPLYVQPTLEGVHRGLKLVDTCLELADAQLYSYLRSKNLSAEIYAFPSVLTLCACTPPLDQVLQLWDFLLAFGIHLNVLCVVSQLLLIRDEILKSPSPMKLLRNFPPLEAQPIIGITVTLVRDLPEQLYDQLVKHPYYPSLSN